MTFLNTFTLPGYQGNLPAGEYEVLVEEELIQGLSFDAYRRTATYLSVQSKGRTELRPTCYRDLKEALKRDANQSEIAKRNGTAFSHEEDKE
ncbi:hypothetical protein [Paracoccus sp. 1_MG-2023]|uniref:hypothetical protein n=1 Tax=Paracoccus sp. 1_MG-2023 TaxID=3062651 RepID=UPI0026E43A59|nr:hypothetical protein [Paracoccus sp. 1_MG-2023]